MPSGSKPGERRGGRKAGIPNKATLQREAQIAAERKGEGLEMSKTMLARAANEYYRKAMSYLARKKPDFAKYDEYIMKMLAVASVLIPFESPRLQSIALSQQRLDLSKLSDKELELYRSIWAKAGSDSAGDRGGARPTTH